MNRLVTATHFLVVILTKRPCNPCGFVTLISAFVAIVTAVAQAIARFTSYYYFIASVQCAPHNHCIARCTFDTVWHNSLFYCRNHFHRPLTTWNFARRGWHFCISSTSATEHRHLWTWLSVDLCVHTVNLCPDSRKLLIYLLTALVLAMLTRVRTLIWPL